MLNAVGDSLSDPASIDDAEDVQDEGDEEDTEQGKLSKDDEPGWVMGTISKTVQCRMERLWQQQMKLDQLTQPGWGDAAEYFRERDKKYGTTKCKVPVVVKTQTDQVAAAPPPTTFAEHLQTVDLVPGISRTPHGSSPPGSSRIRLESGKAQSPKRISSLPPSTALHSSQIKYVMPVEPVRYYHCILPPKLITV